ncbi:MAG: Maltose acetyltransferase [Lichina confinis]|nr:MAG: Maltose acetyltransferase [Lichina confinis]
MCAHRHEQVDSNLTGVQFGGRKHACAGMIAAAIIASNALDHAENRHRQQDHHLHSLQESTGMVESPTSRFMPASTGADSSGSVALNGNPDADGRAPSRPGQMERMPQLLPPIRTSPDPSRRDAGSERKLSVAIQPRDWSRPPPPPPRNGHLPPLPQDRASPPSRRPLSTHRDDKPTTNGPQKRKRSDPLDDGRAAAAARKSPALRPPPVYDPALETRAPERRPQSSSVSPRRERLRASPALPPPPPPPPPPPSASSSYQLRPDDGPPIASRAEMTWETQHRHSASEHGHDARMSLPSDRAESADIRLAEALQRDIQSHEPVRDLSTGVSPDDDDDDDPDSGLRQGSEDYGTDRTPTSASHNKNNSSAAGVDHRRRKRVFSNRTKTGCMTCRRRKKKCDEKKPECEFLVIPVPFAANPSKTLVRVFRRPAAMLMVICPKGNNCLRGGFVCEGYNSRIEWQKSTRDKPPVPLQAKDGDAAIERRPALHHPVQPPPPHANAHPHAHAHHPPAPPVPVGHGASPESRVVPTHSHTLPPITPGPHPAHQHLQHQSQPLPQYHHHHQMPQHHAHAPPPPPPPPPLPSHHHQHHHHHHHHAPHPPPPPPPQPPQPPTTTTATIPPPPPTPIHAAVTPISSASPLTPSAGPRVLAPMPRVPGSLRDEPSAPSTHRPGPMLHGPSSGGGGARSMLIDDEREPDEPPPSLSPRTKTTLPPPPLTPALYPPLWQDRMPHLVDVPQPRPESSRMPSLHDIQKAVDADATTPQSSVSHRSMGHPSQGSRSPQTPQHQQAQLQAQLALQQTKLIRPRQDREKMLTGDPFDPNSAELVQERERCRKALSNFNNLGLGTSRDDRARLLHDILRPVDGPGSAAPGADDPENVVVEAPFRCDYGYNIRVGDDVQIGVDCHIMDSRTISIGSRTVIGPGVKIVSSSIHVDRNRRSGGPAMWLGKPVTIEEDCFVGPCAVIL